jgi:hypothetical protein
MECLNFPVDLSALPHSGWPQALQVAEQFLSWRQDTDHVPFDRLMGPIFSCSTYVHIKAKL